MKVGCFSVNRFTICFTRDSFSSRVWQNYTLLREKSKHTFKRQTIINENDVRFTDVVGSLIGSVFRVWLRDILNFPLHTGFRNPKVVISSNQNPIKPRAYGYICARRRQLLQIYEKFPVNFALDC